MDDVRRLLGEPDQILSDPDRETWVYCHFRATVEVFAETTTDAMPSEELPVPPLSAGMGTSTVPGF
ncbi:MAG TPA: hypothetical protein VNL18_10830 [Gemmatimonadales bacterium]|nr:hypothetical protein [Gemmatimonadales bacterium]